MQKNIKIWCKSELFDVIASKHTVNMHILIKYCKIPLNMVQNYTFWCNWLKTRRKMHIMMQQCTNHWDDDDDYNYNYDYDKNYNETKTKIKPAPSFLGFLHYTLSV